MYAGVKTYTAYDQYTNDTGALFKLNPSVALGYTINVALYPDAKDDPNLIPYTSFESASTEAIDQFEIDSAASITQSEADFEAAGDAAIADFEAEAAQAIATAEQDFDDQIAQFNATFTAQFAYKRIGNISAVAGQQLQEADKLDAYSYPDDSGDWYGPIQSQSFPITIPSNPAAGGSWALVSAPSYQFAIECAPAGPTY